jgi:hypothetical protein
MSTSRSVRVESQSLEFTSGDWSLLISVIRFRFQEWFPFEPDRGQRAPARADRRRMNVPRSIQSPWSTASASLRSAVSKPSVNQS